MDQILRKISTYSVDVQLYTSISLGYLILASPQIDTDKILSTNNILRPSSNSNFSKRSHPNNNRNGYRYPLSHFRRVELLRYAYHSLYMSP